ncbi:MAG: hypothetical protein EOO43_08030 [Flavobacterium sp.]|nr:MAG: hypothetical protein EOO43_08030 [Flavobacterium sp.]
MEIEEINEELDGILSTYKDLTAQQIEALKEAILLNKGKVDKKFFKRYKIDYTVWIDIIKLLYKFITGDNELL